MTLKQRCLSEPSRLGDSIGRDNVGNDLLDYRGRRSDTNGINLANKAGDK